MNRYNKNYYLHVRVTKQEIERYRRVADDLGLNVSSLTRFTLNNFINKTKKPHPRGSHTYHLKVSRND